VSYGREDVVLDGTQRRWEEITNQWAGWITLGFMAVDVLFAKLHAALRGRDALLRAARVTTFVNAAVVAGPKNELQNQPIVCVL
jgi:hypothetical protein